MNFGRRLLQPVVLTVLVVLATGMLTGAGPSPAPVASPAWLPDLSVYQILVPPGTHFVALPLVPGSRPDLSAVLGPSILSAESVEYWDPARGAFVACFPSQPGGGTQAFALSGSVLRLRSKQPLLLQITGTPPASGWTSALAPADRLFGIRSTAPVAVRDLLAQLTATTGYVSQPGQLFAWDLSSGAWQDVFNLAQDFPLAPGTALRRGFQEPVPVAIAGGPALPAAGPAPAGATRPAPTAVATRPSRAPESVGETEGGENHDEAALAASGFPPSEPPALAGALRPDGTALSIDGWNGATTSVSSPEAPEGFEIDRSSFRFQGDDAPRLGAAMMELPAPLRGLTNLPERVPVLVHYLPAEEGKSPEVQYFEILGITSLTVGAPSDSFTITSTSAIPLALSPKGSLHGLGRATVPVVPGLDQPSPGAATTLAGAPVAISYSTLTTRPNPVYALDLMVDGIPNALPLRRFVRSPLAASAFAGVLPQGATDVTRLSTNTLATSSFWVNVSPKLSQVVSLTTSSSWSGKTLFLPARIGADSPPTKVTCVSGGGVTGASYDLFGGAFGGTPPSLMTPAGKVSTLSQPKIPMAGALGSVLFYPSGLTRLPIEPSAIAGLDAVPSWEIFGTHVAIALQFPDSVLSLTFDPSIALNQNAGLATPQAQLGLALTLAVQVAQASTVLQDVAVYLRYTVGASTSVDVPAITRKALAGLKDFATAVRFGAGIATLKDGFAQLLANVKNLGSPLSAIDGSAKAFGLAASFTPTTQSAIDVFVSGESLTEDSVKVPGQKNKTHVYRGGLTVAGDAGKSIKLNVSRGVEETPNAAGVTSITTVAAIELDGSIDATWLPATAQGVIGGQLLYVHEAGPAAAGQVAPITNRLTFRLAGPLGVDAGSTDLWPGPEPGAKGAEDFVAEVQDLTVEATAKSGHKIKSKAQFAVDAYLGTVSTQSNPDAEDASGRGGLLSFSKSWEAELDAAAPAASTTPTTSVLDRAAAAFNQLVPGPSPLYDAYKALREKDVEKEYSVAVAFNNLGTKHLRLNGFEVEHSEDELVLLGNVGFRLHTDEGFPWAELVVAGTREKDAKGESRWSQVGAFLADFRMTTSPTTVTAKSAYLVVTPREETASVAGHAATTHTTDSQWPPVAFGAEVDTRFSGSSGDPLLRDGFTVGIDADLGSKLFQVYASIQPPCDVTEGKFCLQNATINGSLDLSHETCKQLLWTLGGSATMELPRDMPHVGSPIQAGFSAVVCGKSPQSASVSASFTTTINDHWAVAITGLGYKRDFVTKTNSWTGTVAVSMPPGLTWGPFQSLPSQVVGSISGSVGGPMQLDASFTPPVAVGGRSLNLQINQLHFTKASPWAGGLKAQLTTKTTTHACDVTFSTTDELTFAAPPADQVTVELGSTTFTFTNFAVVIAKAGSTYTLKVRGNTSLDQGGTTLSGDAELDVSSDGSFSGTISNVSGASFAPSALGGFGITLGSIGIDDAKGADGKSVLGASANASITFPNDWVGIGGDTFGGTVNVSSSGDFRFTIDTNADLGLSGFPIEVDIRKLYVDSKKTADGREYSAGGDASVIIKRPLNVLLGKSGNTTASFDCEIAVQKDQNKKTSIVFGAKLGSDAKFTFDNGFAKGELDISQLGLSTGPNVLADIKLYLDGLFGSTFSPSTDPATNGHAFMLDFDLSLQGKNISFTLTATPELKLDLVVFKLDFKDIVVKEMMAGMVGVGATMGFSLGIDFLMCVRAQLTDFVYILPSSWPEFGFPFFPLQIAPGATDVPGIDVALTLLGFSAKAGLSNPGPTLDSSALGDRFSGLVGKAFSDPHPLDDSDSERSLASAAWQPLKDYLNSTDVSVVRNIYRGPGIGDVQLGMPLVLKSVFKSATTTTWFPGEPYATTVLPLNLISDMHYLTDLVPAADIVTGVVDAFEFLKVVSLVFSDPQKLVYLIPPSKRSGSMNVSFAGSDLIEGSYNVAANQEVYGDGSDDVIPGFATVFAISRWVDQNVNSIPAIMSTTASLVNGSYACWTGNATATFTITDRWTSLRAPVTKALGVMDQLGNASQPFDEQRSLLTVTRLMNDQGGGLLENTETSGLIAFDKTGTLKLFGQTAPFTVKDSTGRELYSGSVPLGAVTTVPVGAQTLVLTCKLGVSGTQVLSVVNGSLIPGADQDFDQRLARWQAARAAFEAAVDQNKVQNQAMNEARARSDRYERKRQAFLAWQNYDQQITTFENQSARTAGTPGGPPPPAPPPGPRVDDPGPPPTQPPISVTQVPPDPGPQPVPSTSATVDLGVVFQRPLYDWSASAWPTGDAATAKVIGWVAVLSCDDAPSAPPVNTLTVTDYGTVKFEAPARGFTAVLPGSILSDLREAIHVIQGFKDQIFGYDSSPYMLGLSVWSSIYNDASIAPRIDRVTSRGRNVDITYKDSGARLSFVLEKLAYLEQPPAGKDGVVKPQELDLSGATDIQSFEVVDNKLKASTFQMTVKGAGNEQYSHDVSDLMVFDGGPEMAKILAKCAAQRKYMVQTDIQKLEAMGLTVDADPLIVKSLQLTLEQGQVGVRMRPQQVQFLRTQDESDLLTITGANRTTLDQLEQSGPYGDPWTYPSLPGRYLAFSYPGTQATTFAASATQQVTTVPELHRVLGDNVVHRQVVLLSPPQFAGTKLKESAPGMLEGMVLKGGSPWFSIDADQYGMQAEDVTQYNTPPTKASSGADPNPPCIVPGVNDAPPDPATKPSQGYGRVTLHGRRGASGITGTIDYQGSPRKLIFAFDSAGVPTLAFKFDTGHMIPGGFLANLTLNLGIPSVFDISMYIDGAIKFNGFFHFEVDVEVKLIGKELTGAYAALDSSDGLSVCGKIDAAIAEVDVEGNVNKSGASFSGHLLAGLNALGGFSGIDAQAAIQSYTSPYATATGDLMVIGAKILHETFQIGSDSISGEMDLSAGPCFADFSMLFEWKPDIVIGGSITAGIHLFWPIGSIHITLGVTIDLTTGTVCFKIGPARVTLNIPHFGISFALFKGC